MKILLVDDERGFLNAMGDVLRLSGHDVSAENGKQARESLEFDNVDLIVSDVFMPTLDGVRFHDYVREFTDSQDVPFIFMSGYDDEQTRNLVVNPAIDFFFSKTTPVEKVLALIETSQTPEAGAMTAPHGQLGHRYSAAGPRRLVQTTARFVARAPRAQGVVSNQQAHEAAEWKRRNDKDKRGLAEILEDLFGPRDPLRQAVAQYYAFRTVTLLDRRSDNCSLPM